MKNDKYKKHKIILFLTIFCILIPGIFFGSLYKAYAYIENTKHAIWKEGYEVGRFDQLNEDAENTQLEIKAKQQANKDKLLKDLVQLESLGGNKRKVLDSNNRYSLGLYHFQAQTVVDMYRRYYKKNISITEAVNIANDDVLATQLAHDAIFIHKEYKHWFISMCKLGVITENCLTQKQINNLFAKK